MVAGQNGEGTVHVVDDDEATRVLVARVLATVGLPCNGPTREALAVVDRLSPRERQVFLAVVDGKANRAVAADPGLSEKTVEEHRARVMSKLGASSLVDLVNLAVIGGFCEPAEVLQSHQGSSR